MLSAPKALSVQLRPLTEYIHSQQLRVPFRIFFLGGCWSTGGFGVGLSRNIAFITVRKGPPAYIWTRGAGVEIKSVRVQLPVVSWRVLLVSTTVYPDTRNMYRQQQVSTQGAGEHTKIETYIPYRATEGFDGGDCSFFFP